jgi:hypothetical protein
MANAPALPEQIVYLIIRFTASIPDLPLSINTRRTPLTLSLKQLIRQHLPSEHASARLRLIYAGKVLADTDPLSKSLRLPPPPPPRNVNNSDGVGGGAETNKSKGKQPLRETPAVEYGTTTEIPPDAKKYYIHCSLGDALSASELASEATLAQTTKLAHNKSPYPSSSTPSQQRRASSSTTTTAENNHVQRRSSTGSATATTTPQAQGFDRLLSSGFTRDEIAVLRATFTQNLSFTHTPDTMPTPAQMRVLEDRWLDSSATDPSASLTGTTATGGAGAETGWGAGFAAEEGGLDDMLYGYLTGFFFPLGSLVWGFREEGVWTRRRQVAVVMGVVLNCVFGFMRWGG